MASSASATWPAVDRQPARGARWLVYALGGGLGHLTRALALSRAAAARGARVRVLTNSPFAGMVRKHAPSGVSITAFGPQLDRDAIAQAVGAVIARGAFDVLVVDTFPRGLAGELLPHALPWPKVLIHRDVTPRYALRPAVQAAANSYDLLLLPGESAPFASQPRSVRTAPWLVQDADTLLDRAAARHRLGAPATGRLVAVTGCGLPEEVLGAARLAAVLGERLRGRAHTVLVAPEVPDRSSGVRHVRLWPLIDALPGVDVLVGAGGYNTVHEARATGTPLVAIARPRLYDRQAARLWPAESVADERAAVERACALASIERPVRLPAAGYERNGVHAAVRRIEALLDRPGGRLRTRAQRRPGLREAP